MEINNIFHTLKGRTPSLMGYQYFKRSSIMIPLVDKDGETHVLFEVRSMNLRSQPGDVCFPGGRIDPSDKDPLHTAVRETREELGLTADDISDLIPLDYIINDLGRIIYPFVGRLKSLANIAPNPDEVDSIFTVPLAFFLKTEPERYKVHIDMQPEKDFPFHLIVGGEDYQWRLRAMEEHFYQYNGQTIWGLTARILTHFIELIKQKENR
ncbi:NUDIX hydrolase [Gracilibacillus alcaliphilus]|uniref:NUDIX hydrolase n=1 Tax=Gracilibacillus alcaliphilus TaxID=1401441 RepID=UPI00195F029F|nr:CoA pyrophosphatase [Gracilibacillus alcaliphilus]MBM7677277.1 8-oxo-dGTP pyrophosphatase MutT (NUDIX family) [Gracilibacillus alcaliphilus]